MTRDFNARLERLEQARKAERQAIDNPPPIVEVWLVDSNGDGSPSADPPELGWRADPLPRMLAEHDARVAERKARAQRGSL